MVEMISLTGETTQFRQKSMRVRYESFNHIDSCCRLFMNMRRIVDPLKSRVIPSGQYRVNAEGRPYIPARVEVCVFWFGRIFCARFRRLVDTAEISITGVDLNFIKSINQHPLTPKDRSQCTFIDMVCG